MFRFGSASNSRGVVENPLRQGAQELADSRRSVGSVGRMTRTRVAYPATVIAFLRRIGKKGGSSKSPAKVRASRVNARKGGRPRLKK